MKPTVFIAAAGPPRTQIQTITHKTKSAGMVPVNGKPTVGWILDDLIDQGFMDFILLIPKNDEQSKNYVNHRYRTAHSLVLLEVENTKDAKGVAHSFHVGLKELRAKSKAKPKYRLLYQKTLEHGVLLILGHTICRIPNFKNDAFFLKDFIVYSPVSREVSRWCYIDTDERSIVTAFDDKPKERKDLSKALIGIYNIRNLVLLDKKLSIVLRNNPRANLSEALSGYIKTEEIKAIAAPKDQWFDCGKIIGLNKTRNSMFDVRIHNPVRIDADKGILHKTNENSTDLHGEYMWYLGLPKELQTFVPRVINYSHKKRNEDNAEMSLEYYGYPTIAEAWIYDNWDINIWHWAIEKLLNISRMFREYKAELSLESYQSMYWDKTLSRVEKLHSQNACVSELFKQDEVVINGIFHYGWEKLKIRIEPLIDNLYHFGSHTTFIHGDFHFGNILFDVHSRLVKLIDPRGNFGAPGVFGDCKYDLAKLRHSISGGYNFISHDLYRRKLLDDNQIEFTLPYTDEHKEIVKEFDQMLVQEGFLIEDIKLIEGLLFISMIPLHSDHSDRQKAFFARGIMLLNEVVHDNYDQIAIQNFDQVYRI